MNHDPNDVSLYVFGLLSFILDMSITSIFSQVDEDSYAKPVCVISHCFGTLVLSSIPKSNDEFVSKVQFFSIVPSWIVTGIMSYVMIWDPVHFHGGVKSGIINSMYAMMLIGTHFLKPLFFEYKSSSRYGLGFVFIILLCFPLDGNIHRYLMTDTFIFQVVYTLILASMIVENQERFVDDSNDIIQYMILASVPILTCGRIVGFIYACVCISFSVKVILGDSSRQHTVKHSTPAPCAKQPQVRELPEEFLSGLQQKNFTWNNVDKL